MSLMYEVNTINAAMVKAAEICRQDMPEGEKVNAVLACFAGMKPVEAERVVHDAWETSVLYDGDWNRVFRRVHRRCEYQCHSYTERGPSYCPNCGAKMDAREVEM